MHWKDALKKNQLIIEYGKSCERIPTLMLAGKGNDSAASERVIEEDRDRKRWSGREMKTRGVGVTKRRKGRETEGRRERGGRDREMEIKWTVGCRDGENER